MWLRYQLFMLTVLAVYTACLALASLTPLRYHARLRSWLKERAPAGFRSNQPPTHGAWPCVATLTLVAERPECRTLLAG